VANTETITFVRSDFIGNKLRWRIDGTDTVLAGQTMTVTYNNGTRSNGTSLVGTVIGTATVDPTGAWTVDLVVGTNDIRNMSNGALFGVRPTQVKATSSLSVRRRRQIQSRSSRADRDAPKPNARVVCARAFGFFGLHARQ
jgi:hypothetical protein